jgi:hypothetical protein
MLHHDLHEQLKQLSEALPAMKMKRTAPDIHVVAVPAQATQGLPMLVRSRCGRYFESFHYRRHAMPRTLVPGAPDAGAAINCGIREAGRV